MEDLWQLCGQLTNKLEAEQLDLATMIMRFIWLQRKEFIFNNKVKALYAVMEEANFDKHEFLLAVNTEKQNLHTLVREEVVCQPPIYGRV